MLCAVVLCAAAGIAFAGPTEEETRKLAQDAQNPVSYMMTVPVQSNFYFGEGPHDRFGYTLNIQPVCPLNVGDWNLISRTIFPVVYEPNLPFKNGGDMGIGDIQETVFLSPAKPTMLGKGEFIWGAGPMIEAPGANNKALGNQKWCIGPSGVAVWMPGRWVVGSLCYNLLYYAGVDERQDVNAMTLQYFVNYNFNGGWYLATSPEMVFNWAANYDNRFLIPVGGGGGRVFTIGKQSYNVSCLGFYNVSRPVGDPDWQIRFTVQLLFPEHK